MLKFKAYITEGRSRGEAMEDVIVSAVNGKPQGDKKFNLDAEAGIRVAKFLKQNGITGKGQVLGADQIEVTPEWSKFWDGKVPPTTKTPKTDFMVGKAKISLKSGDAAQLMSGGRNESLATFYAALEKTKGDMDKKIADKLTSMFEGLAPRLAGEAVTKVSRRRVFKVESRSAILGCVSARGRRVARGRKGKIGEGRKDDDDDGEG